MNILEIDQHLPKVLGISIAYIAKEYGESIAGIANMLELSTSYLYKMRNQNANVNIDSRRRALAKLVHIYDFSIVNLPEGGYDIVEREDILFHKYIYNIYMYDKDSKSIDQCTIEISMVENDVKIPLDESHYVTGNYEWDDGVTKMRLYRISEYERDSDRAILNINSLDLIFKSSFSVPLTENYYGFFAKNSGFHRVSTGRIVILKEGENKISNKATHYLTNDKFHEFFKYEIFIENEELLDSMLSEYNNNYKTVVMEIPRELANPYQQFLSFFIDYVEVIKGKNIKFDVLKSENGLTVDVELLDNEVSMSEVESYFDEYVTFTKQNIENLKVNVETNLSANDLDIFLLDLKGQINNFKHGLEIAHLKNKMLTNENEKLTMLLSKSLDSKAKIDVQLINGGNQQFSDKIKN